MTHCAGYCQSLVLDRGWDGELTVVDVSVLMSAARRFGFGRVGHIDHEETALASGVAAGSDGVDHLGIFVGDDVVRTSEAVEPRGHVLVLVKDDWFLDFEQLSHEHIRTAVESKDGVKTYVPFSCQRSGDRVLGTRRRCIRSHRSPSCHATRCWWSGWVVCPCTRCCRPSSPR